MGSLRRAGATEAATELCRDIVEQYPGAAWAQQQLGTLALDSVCCSILEPLGRSSAAWQNHWQNTFLFVVRAWRAGNWLLLTSCSLAGKG